MYLKACIVVFCAIFVCSESAFLDTLNSFGKCSVKDNECQKKLYTNAIQAIAKTGIPENGIPPFDPFVVKNVGVPVLNLVNVSMTDGVAKNLKSCYFNHINTTIESYHSTMEITCDNVVIKGKYKVTSDNPLIGNLVGGGDVRGDGTVKLKIEKLHITFDFDIFLREADGEVFIDCKYEDTKYKYDFGKVVFDFNNLFIGGNDFSRPLVAFLNNNSEFIMSTFSRPFMVTSLDFVYQYTHKFFDVTPARFYLLEDLREWLADSPKKN